MFRLVVLSALVAVSMAAPSGLIAPLAYSGPSLTVVNAAPAYSYVKAAPLIASVPTSVSSHSSSVVHGASAFVAAPVATPVVAVKTAAIASVPTSVSTYSNSVVHDSKPVVAVNAVSEAVELVEPTVEVKAAPAVEVAPAVEIKTVSVPKTISSQSSTVVHDAKAFVAAPAVQYVAEYAAPAVEVRAAPVVQYSAPIAHYAAPIAQYSAHYAAPVAYSTHGLVSSNYVASAPLVNAW